MGLSQAICAVQLFILLLETVILWNRFNFQPPICPDNLCCTVPPSATVQRNLSSHRAFLTLQERQSGYCQRECNCAASDGRELACFYGCEMEGFPHKQEMLLFWVIYLCVRWLIVLFSVVFLPWFDKWVQLSLNLQVDVTAGWRFYWAVINAVPLNNAKRILWYCRRGSWFFRSWRKTPQTHDKNQKSRFATEPSPWKWNLLWYFLCSGLLESPNLSCG